jgi:hypothetical protein
LAQAGSAFLHGVLAKPGHIGCVATRLEIEMIVRFTTSDGVSGTGYVTRDDGDSYRVCIKTSDYVSVLKTEAEVV